MYWSFVDVPDLHLYHLGHKEVELLIDLMEPEFDELMLFDPKQYGKDGEIQDNVYDPSQMPGKQSIKPKYNIENSLKDRRTPESDSFCLESQYHYKKLLHYLKVNSRDRARPLTPIGVSGHLYWTLVMGWTFILGVSNVPCFPINFALRSGRADVRTGRF